jgi:tRNA(Ser,Leu) C12 N-acetylase TAN1
MFSEKEVVKIKNILHSNDTIRRRIDEMAEDILKEITEKIIQKKQFALQLDETIDISSCAQLMVFVRYIDDEYEKESANILF